MDEKYIAGFFDGEGSAMITTNKQKLKTGTIFRFRPVIRIVQKHRFILDEIYSYLGFGHVTGNYLGCFLYVVNGKGGIHKFVARIAPHTPIKREMLFLVNELADFQESHSTNVPYSLEDTLKMIELRDKVFLKNQKNRRGLKQKYPKEMILQETAFVKDIEKWKEDRRRLGTEALNSYAKSIKKPRDLLIECACGCGTFIQKYDAKGRQRKFVSGHNQRGKHWGQKR